MNHLTDEEFEDAMRDGAAAPPHVEECPLCKDRIAEMRAVRGRLRTAFASVRGGDELIERVRSGLRDAAGEPTSASPGGPAKVLRGRRMRWPAFAAAAAVLIVAVPLGMHVLSTEPAQAELVRIHEHSISPHREIFASADPNQLAVYLKDKLGFTPAVPRLRQGMTLRGCCVNHFRGRIAGSYVVDTPRGVLSIIVVTDTPESLGMVAESRGEAGTLWTGSFARCQIAAVRLHGYSYCAVGEVSRELLTELLDRLVPSGE